MKLGTSTPGLIALAALLLTVPARADQPVFTRATLLIPPCAIDGVNDGDLRAAATLELEAQGIGLAPIGQLSTTDALVRFESNCLPGSEVVVRAAWAGQERARTLNIGELPPRTRARALALSLAELLGSFRKGVEPEPVELSESEPAPAAPEQPVETEPKPPPASAAAPAPAPKPARRPRTPPIQWMSGNPPADSAPKAPAKARDAELGVTPEARLFASGDLVSGLRPHLDAGVVGVGISVVGGSATAGNGTVSALLLHAVCTLRLLESASDEPVSVVAGPRFGLGLARMEGVPFGDAVGLEALGPYLDGGAHAMLELRPISWLRFGLGAELGYALGMVALADGQPVAEFGGLFIGGLADLSLSL